MGEFIESYFCFPISTSQQLEEGNRIVMPESALQRLINRNIDFPYYFHITNCNNHSDHDDDSVYDQSEWNFSDHDSDYSVSNDDDDDDQKQSSDDDDDQKQSSDDDDDDDEEEKEELQRSETDEVKENYPYSHCGVSEFTSEEGIVLLPQWIMSNLGLQNGDSVVLRSVKLGSGNYVKLNPLDANFLKITDPKAVLETRLRRFACLTTGDVIPIVYNHVTYHIRVLETKPASGISIIETDCEVEFFVPEPVPAPAKAIAAAECKKVVGTKKTEDDGGEIKFKPFSGMGRRLDGVEIVRDGMGKIALNSAQRLPEEEMTKNKSNKFQAFTGKSRSVLDN